MLLPLLLKDLATASLPEYICCHTLTPDWLLCALKNSTQFRTVCSGRASQCSCPCPCWCSFVRTLTPLCSSPITHSDWFYARCMWTRSTTFSPVIYRVLVFHQLVKNKDRLIQEVFLTLIFEIERRKDSFLLGSQKKKQTNEDWSGTVTSRCTSPGLRTRRFRFFSQVPLVFLQCSCLHCIRWGGKSWGTFSKPFAKVRMEKLSRLQHVVFQKLRDGESGFSPEGEMHGLST